MCRPSQSPAKDKLNLALLQRLVIRVFVLPCALRYKTAMWMCTGAWQHTYTSHSLALLCNSSGRDGRVGHAGAEWSDFDQKCVRLAPKLTLSGFFSENLLMIHLRPLPYWQIWPHLNSTLCPLFSRPASLFILPFYHPPLESSASSLKKLFIPSRV